jgi:hypothetical protein
MSKHFNDFLDSDSAEDDTEDSIYSFVSSLDKIKNLEKFEDFLMDGEVPEIVWNKEESQLKIGSKKINIAKGTQHNLCCALFKVPFGKRIPEDNIDDDDPEGMTSSRKLYDTVIAINKKVERETGIKKFIEYKDNEIGINKKLSK